MSNYPYYPTYPSYPTVSPLASLESRINALESGINNFTPQPVTSQGGAVSAPQAKSFISVQSESEAFSHTPDWGGAKSYFINENNGEIYVQFFDASVPKSYKLKAIFSEVGNDELNIEQQKSDVPGAIVSLTEKVSQLDNTLSAFMSEIRESLKSVEVAKPPAKSSKDSKVINMLED